ncbi:embryonic polarity protein dorsal-like isoform X1 [Cydia splendana]|uniref:embryonic polarity protein dorsal-like isoform X1 n=2 Tax=Cydia splendana TaxID=1100963 RepID=UPI00300DADFD
MDDIGDALQGVAHNDEEAPPDLNISEVLHAISIADPTFGVGVDEMYRQPTAPPPSAPQPSGAPKMPYVRIIEQPAGKSLRFRYECEGRSAGSIPGVHSTPEKKTYPTIEVVGYTGRFVVLVSCVTRDKPYRPHPHNLVGREPLCNRGVCTVECNADNSIVQFSNLGIQCVKRKDIAEALRVREEIKVDPFKTGFSHKNQPQNIDLNAVRLCFQVYIPGGNTSKIKQALIPVVSDVIYDKKAMCELQINRLSTCAASVRGGTELILLCEKVTRDDVDVVFSQAFDDGSVWEASANIVLVHKQVAIAFQAPAYRDPMCMENVKVKIFLKRVSDGARSAPVDFEYTPDYAGTTRKALPDRNVLSLLLADRTDSNNNDDKRASCSSDSVSPSDSGDSGEADIADLNGTASDPPLETEKGLDELLDQVAELDEIYTENRTRLQNVASAESDDADDFNDAGTYTSLQLAFRNPVLISDPEQYEDVQVQTYRGPIIEFAPLKRDTDDERAPPLPPKRIRKTPSVEGFKTSQTSVNSFLKPGRQLPITRNLDTSRNELTTARSEPALPPAPKKRSFLSRLFRRKEKSPAPSIKSEGKASKKSKPVGRSVSSVSGVRPSKFKSSVSHTSLKDNASGTGLSYADSVTHISLHGDDNEKTASQTRLSRPASLHPLPPTDGDTILVAESVLALDASQFKKLQDDLDLTDAEHYALYMAVAPHATVSEFDETSCYYSPVDGSKFQN